MSLKNKWEGERVETLKDYSAFELMFSSYLPINIITNQSQGLNIMLSSR